MTTLNVNTIEPAGNTLTLGASGDSVVLADDVKVNTYKDAGGNTLFVSNGSGVLSSVNSGFGDALKLLQTQTVSSAVASVAFTSGITSTYKEYIFKFFNVLPATDGAYFKFQASTNGGSSYGMNITSTSFMAQKSESAGANGALGYRTSDDLAQSTDDQVIALTMGSGADEGCSGKFHLFNPASTTYIKHFYAEASVYNDSNLAMHGFSAGYINSALDVDAIIFRYNSGNIAAGKIKMYGVL